MFWSLSWVLLHEAALVELAVASVVEDVGSLDVYSLADDSGVPLSSMRFLNLGCMSASEGTLRVKDPEGKKVEGCSGYDKEWGSW